MTAADRPDDLMENLKESLRPARERLERFETLKVTIRTALRSLDDESFTIPSSCIDSINYRQMTDRIATAVQPLIDAGARAERKRWEKEIRDLLYLDRKGYLECRSVPPDDPRYPFVAAALRKPEDVT